MSDLFELNTKDVRARKQRYTLGPNAKPTAEGGRVGVGVDPNGERYLVHADIPSRATEAVALGAFATALVHALPMENVVRLFKAEGRLKELHAAAVKLDPSLAPKEPKAPKAPAAPADTPAK